MPPREQLDPAFHADGFIRVKLDHVLTLGVEIPQRRTRFVLQMVESHRSHRPHIHTQASGLGIPTEQLVSPPLFVKRLARLPERLRLIISMASSRPLDNFLVGIVVG